MVLPAIGEIRRSGRAPRGGTNSARSAAAVASACPLVLWPAAEDGAGADGDVGRADVPVLVLVITAAVMAEVAQPAVIAAASRIRRSSASCPSDAARRIPVPGSDGWPLAGLRGGSWDGGR
jgi:hypothetical protein